MSSSSLPPAAELPTGAKDALELLLRAPDPRRDAEVARARDTFCHAVGALRKRGVTLPHVIVLIEAVARKVGATSDTVLAVVGLCADDFGPPSASGR